MNVSEEDKADLAAGKVDYMAFSYYNSSCITTHEVDATVKGNMMDSIKTPIWMPANGAGRSTRWASSVPCMNCTTAISCRCS